MDRCSKLRCYYPRSAARAHVFSNPLKDDPNIRKVFSEMRSTGRVSDEHRSKASDLAERFRALELEGDAYQNQSKLLKIQDEVEVSIPFDQLWLPQE
jgi:hypothetical protein